MIRTTLEDVCISIVDGPFGSSLKTSDYVDFGVPVLQGKNITGDKFVWKEIRYISDQKAKEVARSSAIVGDHIVIKIGSIGYSAILDDLNGHDFAIIPANLARIRPDRTKLDDRFLHHWLKSDEMKRYFRGGASTTAQPALSLGKIREAPIPLPPLEEQKRIAEILDQADALRRLRARALDRLNALGQAIFHEMFGDTELNQKGLARASLNELIRFVGGTQPPKTNFLYEDGPDRVRFVQTRDFRTDAYKTYLPAALAKRPFVEDDVMIGRYGPPVFQIFRGLSGTYNVALMKAEPKANISKNFVFFLLQEPKLHGYVVSNSERTAGQSGVNLELLEAYQAFLPSREMIDAFDARTAIVEQQMESAELALGMAETLFTSLQHRAFRGEL